MKTMTLNNNQFAKKNNNIKRVDDKFKVSGDKVFATLQGEGVLKSEGGTAGCPAIFFRLHWCNLHCGLRSGWKCDTAYTWDINRKEYWTEPTDWTIDKALKEINKSWENSEYAKEEKRLVITGGEPLLQQELITKLVERMTDWKIEIETNGTLEPNHGLVNCQINCSPKLSNSGNEKELRFKPEVLKKINKWPVSWFKFVTINDNDLNEIDEIVNVCQLNTNKILIMPEGRTLDEVEKHRNNVVEKVKDKGWRIINRNQLLWFGSKRRT